MLVGFPGLPAPDDSGIVLHLNPHFPWFLPFNKRALSYCH